MFCEAATWSSVFSTPAVPSDYGLQHFDAFWLLNASMYIKLY